MNDTLLYGGGAAAILYLITGGGEAFPESLEEARSNAQDAVPEEIRTWEPLTPDGELGVGLSGDEWVLYDDPEQGEHDDEAGDDQNVTFEEAGVDGSDYSPDTQDGSTAPSTGAIADAGGSQEWGTAGEQENDDLTTRTAESNLSDDEKSMFDRLANYDDAEQLDSYQDDSVTESGSNYSTTDEEDSSTSTVDDSGDSWEDVDSRYSGGLVM